MHSPVHIIHVYTWYVALSFATSYLQKINLNKEKFILAPSIMVYSYVDGMWKEKTLFLAYNKAGKFNSPVDILTYLYLHNANTVITCIHLCTHINTDHTQTCTNIHPCRFSIFSGTLENSKKHNLVDKQLLIL